MDFDDLEGPSVDVDVLSPMRHPDTGCVSEPRYVALSSVELVS
jgi:hypothetical protein